MDRIHMSKKAWDGIVKIPEQSLHFKPSGIWYSDGNDWIEWCENEMPHWVGEYRYLLDIDVSRVLMLDTVEKILQFSLKYQEGYNIDWVRVSEDWGGIECAPYQWELRFDPRVLWYYTWDVASGCIWDRSVLKGFKRIW